MIVYLAHPVGQDPDERARNLENVEKWFLWLFKNTNWTICVPWFIYVRNLDESHRVRCLRDDLAVLDTCDAVCLTGGKLTGGMQTELGFAQANNARVFDLLWVGYEPPQDSETEAKARKACE